MKHIFKIGLIPFLYSLMSCCAVNTELEILNDSLLQLKDAVDSIAIPVPIENPKKSLKEFSFNAAGVLPMWVSNNNKYVLVSRELYGWDRGTWDSFSGSRDPGEKHPVVTASREFAEETAYALMFEKQALKYIDVDGGNTEVVIALKPKKYVLYITKFSEKDITRLQKEFYSNIKIVKDPKLKEKDALALVSWNELARTIGNLGASQKKVTIEADIINDQGNRKKEKIILRPILVDMLKPYFKNEPYQEGKNKVIRFY